MVAVWQHPPNCFSSLKMDQKIKGERKSNEGLSAPLQQGYKQEQDVEPHSC